MITRSPIGGFLFYIRDYIKGVRTLTDQNYKQAYEDIQKLANAFAQAFKQVCDAIKSIWDVIVKSQVAKGRYVPKPISKSMTLKSQVYYRPVRQVARSRC